MEARAGSSILDFETLFSDFLELLNGSGLNVHFLVCQAVFFQLLRLLSTDILVHKSLSLNLDIKVSKILYKWTLLLNTFCFCETEYLYFTTRVFGHSTISPFLGGFLHGTRVVSCVPV